MPKSNGCYVQYKKLEVTECGICQRQFNSVKVLSLHKKVVHNTGVAAIKNEGDRCAKCGFLSANTVELKMHFKKSCPFRNDRY